MENFVLQLTTNPLLYLEYVLSALGALGILLFAIGFGGGISHLFTYSHSAEHMLHARTRAMWGLYLCMVSLGIWELIRVVLGTEPHTTLILVVLLLSPLWAPPLKRLLFPLKE